MLTALFHRRHHEGEACGDPFLLLSGPGIGLPLCSALAMMRQVSGLALRVLIAREALLDSTTLSQQSRR